MPEQANQRYGVEKGLGCVMSHGQSTYPDHTKPWVPSSAPTGKIKYTAKMVEITWT